MLNIIGLIIGFVMCCNENFKALWINFIGLTLVIICALNLTERR